MSREKPRNLAASVRQKLFNRAQERHEDFGLVLTKYGLERFLYRLAQSKYRDQFVLKGALLFELWTHRPQKAKQWQAFVKKSNLDQDHATLDDVAANITRFVMPPLQAIRGSQHFPLTWPNGGPWSPPNMRT